MRCESGMLSRYGISCYGCAFLQISFGLEREKIKFFFGSFFALFTLWIVLFMVFDISCVCCITSDGMLIVYINSSFLVFM